MKSPNGCGRWHRCRHASSFRATRTNEQPISTVGVRASGTGWLTGTRNSIYKCPQSVSRGAVHGRRLRNIRQHWGVIIRWRNRWSSSSRRPRPGPSIAISATTMSSSRAWDTFAIFPWAASAPMSPNARAKAAKTRKLPPKERAEYKARRARAQLVRRMGVDPDNGWKAEYETLPGKEKVVDELRRSADPRRARLPGDRPRSRGRSHRMAPAGTDRRRSRQVPPGGVQRNHQVRPGGGFPESRQGSTRIASMRSRRGVSSIAWSASSCRRCSGPSVARNLSAGRSAVGRGAPHRRTRTRNPGVYAGRVLGGLRGPRPGSGTGRSPAPVQRRERRRQAFPSR